MSNKLDLSQELIGRRALVTGGTRGIGAAIAQRLLDAGAEVVVAARSRDDDTPAEATFVSGDVTTNEGADAIAKQALAAVGSLDILVNNAGGGGAFLGGSWTIPDTAWNVVSPGVISTPGSAEFAKTTPGFSSDDWVRNIPLGRLGGTEDIAEVVALLASDRGKFITGANYRVDGGMTVR